MKHTFQRIKQLSFCLLKFVLLLPASCLLLACGELMNDPPLVAHYGVQTYQCEKNEDCAAIGQDYICIVDEETQQGKCWLEERTIN